MPTRCPMSLPQLIGLQCVTCQKGINSIIDGAFCDQCGNPMHQRCVGATAEVPADKCPKCGGDPNANIAREVMRERANHLQKSHTINTAESITFPISKVCPQCGHTEFKKVYPNTYLAFAYDRVCNACGTRYSPPTPLWGALLIMAIGVIIGGVGITGFFFGFTEVSPRMLMRSVVPTIIGGLIVFQSVRLFRKTG